MQRYFQSSGLWQGECSMNVSNVSIIVGTYTLNMIDDHQATLVPLRNATNSSPTVGLVDLSGGVLTVKNVTYRRRPPFVGIPYPTFVGPQVPSVPCDPR